jgi:hypothetical protein
MNNYEAKRQEILEEMGTINQMEHGRLSEEYRQREVDGRIHRTGPYYKHQVWRDGKNVTTRVKVDQVPSLREGIEGMDRFKQLSSDFVATTVAMTHSLGEEMPGKKTTDSSSGMSARNRSFFETG